MIMEACRQQRIHRRLFQQCYWEETMHLSARVQTMLLEYYRSIPCLCPYEKSTQRQYITHEVANRRFCVTKNGQFCSNQQQQRIIKTRSNDYTYKESCSFCVCQQLSNRKARGLRKARGHNNTDM